MFKKVCIPCFLFPVSFCLFFQLGFSQSSSSSSPVINDAQVWFNFYVEKKITKQFSVHLNQQDRFNNNVTQFGFAYADIGVTWKLNKKIKFLLDYVPAKSKLIGNNQQYWSNRHQFYFAVMYKIKFRLFNFTYRQMIQNQYNDPLTSKNGTIDHWFDRNKFTLKYDLNKRITFYAAEELYFAFARTVGKTQTERGLDHIRTFMGAFYNISKHQQLEFYFMNQLQLLYSGRQNQDFVYGIGYAIDF